MSKFGDGYFGEDEQDFDNEDEYTDGDHDMPPEMQGTIPAELVDRWKSDEHEIEIQKINLAVLQQTIKLLEKSWLWRFRSLESRIKIICDSYYAMVDLVNDSE